MLVAPAALRAQDAAVEERLEKLSGQIKDLIEAKDAQNKRIEEIAKGLRELQDQQSKPNGNYASQEDFKRLAQNLQEVDRKWQEDNELIIKKIQGLGQTLKSANTPTPTPTPNPHNDTAQSTPKSDKGYEHTVKEGDKLITIVKAYNDKGIKVSLQQVLDANPGLKPETLKIGQKIWIPQP